MQPLILAPAGDVARALTFTMHSDAHVRGPLEALLATLDPSTSVVGFGAPLYRALGVETPVADFAARSFPGGTFPATQGALFVELCGGDRGTLAERADEVRLILGGGFAVQEELELFKHRDSRDLTGYVDGTENPTGDRARAAAIDAHGGSFLLVQRWVHDLARFNARPRSERDHVFGRTHDGDEELGDAPASAHVKRAAQESFDPPAFMVRRSLPFLDGAERGLLFLAFGADTARFDRVLDRMAGREDGLVDALTTFTRATSGGYFYCPPVVSGRVAFPSSPR